MHNCFLIERNMGHVKGISHHEPLLLTTKSMVPLSPQGEQRCPVPPAMVSPLGYSHHFCQLSHYQWPHLPHSTLLSSIPHPALVGKKGFLFRTLCWSWLWFSGGSWTGSPFGSWIERPLVDTVSIFSEPKHMICFTRDLWIFKVRSSEKYENQVFNLAFN